MVEVANQQSQTETELFNKERQEVLDIFKGDLIPRIKRLQDRFVKMSDEQIDAITNARNQLKQLDCFDEE